MQRLILGDVETRRRCIGGIALWRWWCPYFLDFHHVVHGPVFLHFSTCFLLSQFSNFLLIMETSMVVNQFSNFHAHVDGVHGQFSRSVQDYSDHPIGGRVGETFGVGGIRILPWVLRQF